MARLAKDTVEYFPHDTDASGGDTLTALEGQFGNDGYAFWFKLLEKLGRTPGHCFDISEAKPWQVFLGRCHITELKGVEMVNLLVEMGALDKELWETHRVIWSQHLVDNLADVYRNRRREIPQRPTNSRMRLLTTGDNPITTPDNAITTSQSKVKERKEKETESKVESPLTPPVCPSVESVINAYQDNILLGATITEEMEQELTGSCSRYTPAWVADAIKEAVCQNQPTWRYIMGILQNWATERQ